MKKKYFLNFPPQSQGEPITYKLVKDYDVKINILKAKVTPGQEGHLLLEIEASDENLEKAVSYLNGIGVTTEPFVKKLNFKEDDCVNCGSCTAVCFAQALTLNKDDWKLKFDREKCIACELCTKACPLQLFSIEFS